MAITGRPKSKEYNEGIKVFYSEIGDRIDISGMAIHNIKNRIKSLNKIHSECRKFLYHYDDFKTTVIRVK